MRILAIRIEHPFDAVIYCPQHSDASMKQRKSTSSAAMISTSTGEHSPSQITKSQLKGCVVGAVGDV